MPRPGTVSGVYFRVASDKFLSSVDHGSAAAAVTGGLGCGPNLNWVPRRKSRYQSHDSDVRCQLSLASRVIREDTCEPASESLAGLWSHESCPFAFPFFVLCVRSKHVGQPANRFDEFG